jgi:DNA-binding response OmpR family regulator
VVLLDVNLPDASGLDVLSQLKSYSETTPVIMMSEVGMLGRVAALWLQEGDDRDATPSPR